MEQLIAEIRNYIDLKIKYYKLEAVEKLSMGTAKILSLVAVILLVGLSLMLFSVALTVLLYQWIGSLVWAAVIMGGFYLIVAVLFFTLRGSIFTNTMVKTFSKMFFPNNEDDDEEKK